jgi:hypothetical protein
VYSLRDLCNPFATFVVKRHCRDRRLIRAAVPDRHLQQQRLLSVVCHQVKNRLRSPLCGRAGVA